MALVVTGLSQNGDVTALRQALEGAGLSAAPLQVIGPDESTESVARGIIGAELITSDGGTSVPGLNNDRRVQRFFRNESLPDRLGDLEIPDSEMENYVEALERGRSIVAYFGREDTIDRVEELFRGASLLNVRRF
jgi:hypothetical protein